MKQPAAASTVLTDVPWVGFYQGPKRGNPEDHPLPSVMRALVEYRGDDLELPNFAQERGKWRWSACARFHGVTGSGFAFSWKQPYGEGHLGRGLLRSYEQAFAAAGLDCQMVLRSAYGKTQDHHGRTSDDEAEYRRLIVQTIRDRRLPVIAIGMIGPDEPCIICGFQQDGDVLVGWNYFLEEERDDPRLQLDDDGRFVLLDWFRDLRGIVVPGAKLAPPPDQRQVLLAALKRDLALLCGTGSTEDPMGAAAYQAWIRYLLAPLPEAVAADLKQVKPIHEKHNECVGELAERRAYAASFLEQMAGVFPAAADDLQQARFRNQAMHDLLWRVWQSIGIWHKTDDDKLRRFADMPYRVELASLVRRLQAWDLESARHIRAALVRLGVPADELPVLPKPESVAGLRSPVADYSLPGLLGPLWETPQPAIAGVPAPQGPDLAAAVYAAAAVTDWPIDAPMAGAPDWQGWAGKAGWRPRVVETADDDSFLVRAQLVNDIVLSCLYGLPVATTYKGEPAVVVGYNHLAGETLRVRLPNHADDDAPAAIRINDKGWGPVWVFLSNRR